MRDQFRYANYQRAGRITEPQVIYTGRHAEHAAQPGPRQSQSDLGVQHRRLSGQPDGCDRPVQHRSGRSIRWLRGIELGRETSTPTRIRYTGVPTANLLTPNLSQPFAGIPSIQTQINTRSSSYSAYLMDTIEIGEHWELIGGFRWDTFETSFKQYIAPAVSLNRTDNMPSYRAAIVYKPLPNGSVYFAYGTSFNPSAETLSLAVNTADLAPEENETFELGTKWLVNDGRLTLNAAVFQITKLNARVPDPINAAFNILGGNQRVRGFEMGVQGYLTDRWEIFAGYAFLDNKVIEFDTARHGRPDARQHAKEHAERVEYLPPAVVRHRDRRRRAICIDPHRKLHAQRDHGPDRGRAGLRHAAGDGEVSFAAGHRPAVERLQHHQHTIL